LGNVFIALGGVLPAFAGALLRLAETVPALSSTAATVKYLTILLSALLLFIGFQLAVSGAPKK
jgi:predicted tellurium resistance membrane protein TerC